MKNFSLSLYAFHLHHTLTELPGEVVTDANLLWENLVKVTIDSGNSPQSWQDFIKKDCKKWQEQIQTDINYLTPGQELFEQFVDTIRGIVEIRQTESDRSLENTIQVLGIGFGGGAIASGIIVQHIDKINQPLTAISPNNPPHPFYASLLLSLLATFFFIAIGWLITKRQYHPRDKK